MTRKSTQNWQTGELVRISEEVQKQFVDAIVEAYGSVADGTADRYSDLDLLIKGIDPADAPTVLALFPSEKILGQERYVGPGIALYRILLYDGRQYDIKISEGGDPRTRKDKVPLPGTDEFWFALFIAHHSFIRDRAEIARDLIEKSTARLSDALDELTITENSFSQDLSELDHEKEDLEALILEIASLSGSIFGEPERAQAFKLIIASRSVG